MILEIVMGLAGLLLVHVVYKMLDFLTMTKLDHQLEVPPPKFMVKGMNLFPLIKGIFIILPNSVKHWIAVKEVSFPVF